MPTYQYECDACGHSFEKLQSMLDKKLRKCPKCGKSKLYRLIGTGGGIIFKGTGFYETDYKKSNAQSANQSDGSAGAAPVKKEAAKPDAKPDTASSESKAD